MLEQGLGMDGRGRVRRYHDCSWQGQRGPMPPGIEGRGPGPGGTNTEWQDARASGSRGLQNLRWETQSNVGTIETHNLESVGARIGTWGPQGGGDAFVAVRQEGLLATALPYSVWYAGGLGPRAAARR
jgi:hypothetical protein